MLYPLNRKTFTELIQHSPEKRLILYYFYHHPKACETVEDLATHLHKSTYALEEPIQDLVKIGILHNHGPLWGSPFYAGKYVEFYSLILDEELGALLNELEQTHILTE